MKKWLSKLDINDALILLGIILLAIGLALYSIPLALGVIGTILLSIGLFSAWRKGVKTP